MVSLKQVNKWIFESYDSKTDLGITVSSTTQSLLVTSSTGEVLVHFKKPFYKDRNGEEMDQLIFLNDQPFLDHRRDNKATSYSITQGEADELTLAAGQQPESISLPMSLTELYRILPTWRNSTKKNFILQSLLSPMILMYHSLSAQLFTWEKRRRLSETNIHPSCLSTISLGYYQQSRKKQL